MRWLLGIVLWGIRLPPASLAVRLGRLFGWVLHRVLRFRRQVVRGQLRLAFGKELTELDLQQLERRHYRHLGLLAMELLRLPKVARQQLDQRFVYHNLDTLDTALARGKGVLLLGGHIGNWEMCGIALTHRGYTLKAIGKEMKSAAGETLKQMIRDENGVPTIPRRNSMKQILTALKKNQVVVMFIDQNMTSDEGAFVDFFGHAACTMTAMAIIARRTGASVVSGWTFRDDDLYRHHCHIGEIIELDPPSEDKAADLQHHTSRFTDCLETIIRRRPAQWLWIHKRWKTRPADETARPISY